jgi:hypothetical protein
MLKRSRLRPAMVVVLLFGIIGGVSGCFLFPNQPPIASFVVTYDVDPEDSLVVELDATPSSDPNGDAITTYMWTFGDDVTILTPLDFSKTVNVPVLTIRYPDESEAPRTVQLLVIDERGAVSDPVSQDIIVPNVSVEPTL